MISLFGQNDFFGIKGNFELVAGPERRFLDARLGDDDGVLAESYNLGVRFVQPFDCRGVFQFIGVRQFGNPGLKRFQSDIGLFANLVSIHIFMNDF